MWKAQYKSTWIELTAEFLKQLPEGKYGCRVNRLPMKLTLLELLRFERIPQGQSLKWSISKVIPPWAGSSRICVKTSKMLTEALDHGIESEWKIISTLRAWHKGTRRTLLEFHSNVLVPPARVIVISLKSLSYYGKQDSLYAHTFFFSPH